MPQTFWPMILMMALILVLPCATAWLVRRAGLNWGWSVIGGALAGCMLGPTVLGRIMPDRYEQWFIGGVEQRQALDALLSRQGADLAVAEHEGFSKADVMPMRVQHTRERSLVDLQLDAARWNHQQPLRNFALLLVAAVLLGSGMVDGPRVPHPRGWTTIVSIGLWSAILPGGVAFVCGQNWWGLSLAQTLMLVAALAIGPWAILAWDRRAADAAELGGASTIQSAGRVASALAIACAAWAMWSVLGSREMLLAAPLIALPIGWLIPPQPVSHAKMVRFFESIIVPALATIVAMKIDLHEHAALWPIVVVALLCGDGRWFGAVIGALLPGGRRGLRTMRLALGSMAAGPTQLAIAAIGIHTLMLPQAMALSLLIGAVVIEVSAPLRRRLADQMEALEAELDDDNPASDA